MADKSKLSSKQQRFCEEYAVDMNGTRAAMAAGYTQNEKAAAAQATRLLKNAKVAVAIENLKAAQSQRTAVTGDMVIAELARIAFVDIGQMYNEKGGLLPVSEMPEDIRRAVSGIDVTSKRELVESDEDDEGKPTYRYQTLYTDKIRLNDKVAALKLLGSHFKLFTNRLEVKGKVTLAELVAGAQDEDEKE